MQACGFRASPFQVLNPDERKRFRKPADQLMQEIAADIRDPGVKFSHFHAQFRAVFASFNLLGQSPLQALQFLLARFQWLWRLKNGSIRQCRKIFNSQINADYSLVFGIAQYIGSLDLEAAEHLSAPLDMVNPMILPEKRICSRILTQPKLGIFSFLPSTLI